MLKLLWFSCDLEQVTGMVLRFLPVERAKDCEQRLSTVSGQ